MKRKVTAVFFDGDSKTRTTARTYGAAWRATRKEPSETAARNVVYGFTANLALALATAAHWRRHGFNVVTTDNVKEGAQ
jgi:hypothetical protein